MVNRRFLSGALFVIAAAVWSPFSFAQTSYSGLDHINRIINNTPGITTVAVSSGVAATASGNIEVRTASGLRIPVPATATATVSKAAIAGAARVAVRVLGPVGAGITAYEIYKEIKDSGVTTCPPPDFFCKPSSEPASTGVEYKTNATITTAYFSTKLASCQDDANIYDAQKTTETVKNVRLTGSVGSEQCAYDLYNNAGTGYIATQTRTFVSRASQCPAGQWLVNGACSTTAPPGGTYSDQELEQTLQEKMDADFARNKRLYDAMQKDLKERGLAVSPDVLTPKTSPVAITAPPVTTPEKTVKTRTVTNPDGTTGTETSKEKTTVTVTPKPDGTVENHKPEVTAQTTTITTVTNNITNETTVTQDVTDSPPAEEEKPTPEFCKDNPKVLACQTLGQPFEATPVPNQNKPMTITPTVGWGASNGTCPAPRLLFNKGGQPVYWSWDFFCDFAEGVRPLFIAFAWLTAVFSFVGFSRKD